MKFQELRGDGKTPGMTTICGGSNPCGLSDHSLSVGRMGDRQRGTLPDRLLGVGLDVWEGMTRSLKLALQGKDKRSSEGEASHSR